MPQSPLTQEQLDHFRQLLHDEEMSLTAEQDRLMEEVRGYAQEGEQRDDYGEDNADRATDMFEREKNITLTETMTTRLEQVRHALKRMDEGVYGLDEETGEVIPVERLEVMPSATTTVRTASHQREQS